MWNEIYRGSDLCLHAVEIFFIYTYVFSLLHMYTKFYTSCTLYLVLPPPPLCPVGPFSFQTTLHRDGTIAFCYKDVSVILVTCIADFNINRFLQHCSISVYSVILFSINIKSVIIKSLINH